MLTYWLIVCHLIGDYVLQSDWMAQTKTSRSPAAVAHALTYTLPFLVITRSPLALAIIAGSHFVIDRFRLARFVCWAKNFIAPRWIDVPMKLCEYHSGEKSLREGAFLPRPGLCPMCKSAHRIRHHSWAECSATGYHADRPPWLSVWLLIIADNTMHLVANGLALAFCA